MRPEVLELEGFTAFREPTRVDFADAELFALTGPTGAGKSSLIDAMIFALYGRVPRLGGALVEPLISKGRQQSRVRLDFSLGERHYTAVRVVSRTGNDGATTVAASLECSGVVLANKATDLNEKICDLIGLNFRQFTTCVALPQGEFARFLNQPPAERQQLLSQLLGLGIYDLVHNKARDTRSTAVAQLNVLNGYLATLDEVNQVAVDERKARLDDLEKLQELATKQLPELAKLRSKLDSARNQHSAIETQVKALEGVRTPDAVKTLAKATADAEKRRIQTRQALHKADQQAKEAKAHLVSLGDNVGLDNLRTKHLERDKCAGDLEKAKQAEAGTAKTAVERQAALRKAEAAVNVAQTALDDERRTHAAHALQAHLSLNEPCPVCQQEVNALPTVDERGDLGELETALMRCQREKEGAQEFQMDAAKKHAAAEGLWKSKRSDCNRLEALLRNQPPLAEVESRLADIEVASWELEAAEQHLAKKEELADDAAEAVKEAQGREAKEWDGYHDQRDGLADLSPPRPGPALIEAWHDLESWARDQAPKSRAEGAALAEQTRKLEHECKGLHDSLAEAFAKRRIIPFDEAQARVAVATAIAKAQMALNEIRDKLAAKGEYKKQAKAAQSEANTAKALEQHLNATGFKRWLLAAAFDRLVSGASATLRELSSGQYTFHRNAKFEFDVVDHANAGETRSAKTLSGGETFLASLALALTLAERISDLAAAGTARLESIFLDEGFGALDGETLDTVATAIEELSTQGRTVGIVTHVPDLAERVPVRFKVSKTAATAVVERITL